MQQLRLGLLSTACALSLLSGCTDAAGDESPSETTAETTGDGDGDNSGDGDGDNSGDGDGDNSGDGDGDGTDLVSVSGDAFAFTLPGEDYGRIAGATISVLEDPSISTISEDDGHFELFVSPGATATFVLEADGFPPARTKTFTVPADGLELVTFQVPNDELFGLLAGVLSLEVDPGTCQIVSTVTRVGKSIYDAGAHGEQGATVTIDPPLPAEHGPVYFNSAVIPDPSLTETSDDGGILFTNVPPGTYTLHASKDGVVFEDTIMQCEAGVLVNASPPYGLQALP